MPIHLLQNLPHAGEIVVWGDNSKGQISGAPPGNDFHQIATGGGSNSLAIRVSGLLALWGDPGFKALPDWKGPGVPVVKYWGPSADAVIGLTHLLAILPNHSVVPWGNFLNGNPVTPPVGLRASAVAPTANFDVAIDMNGDLIQWGTTKGPVPAGSFTKVSARGDYAIALRDDGRLYGWGNTYFASWPGWIKEGATHYYTQGPFIELAAGVVWKDSTKALPNMPHISALRPDGSVIGWGTNLYGETTTQVGPYLAIAAGMSYSLGLDSGGNIHHWGASGDGVGIDGKTFKGVGTVPVGKYISMGAGANHATAVRVSVVRADPGPDAFPIPSSPATAGSP